VTVTALLVYGEDDPLALPSVGERIAAAIPGSRLAVLPGLRRGITLEGNHG
jgi:3-oxoadipate enol-lactonase